MIRVKLALEEAERQKAEVDKAKRSEQEKYKQTWEAQQNLAAVSNEVQNLF